MKTKQPVLIVVLCLLCTTVDAQSVSVPELIKYLEKRSPAIGRKLKHKGFNVRTYATPEGYDVLFGEKTITNSEHREKLLEEKKKSERYTFEYEVGNHSLLPAYIRQIETEGFELEGMNRARYKTIYYKKISTSSYQPKLIEIVVLDYGDQFVLYFKMRNVRLKAVRGDTTYRRKLCHCRGVSLPPIASLIGFKRK